MITVAKSSHPDRTTTDRPANVISPGRLQVVELLFRESSFSSRHHRSIQRNLMDKNNSVLLGFNVKLSNIRILMVPSLKLLDKFSH